jgi:predicted Rdx family selenoprotein
LNGGVDFDYGPAVESGAGTTVLTSTDYINSGALDLDGGRVVENQGTLNWTGGDINLGDNPNGMSVGGGTLRNDLGATFDITTDATAGNGTIGNDAGVNQVTNAGLFEKTAGTGTTVIDAPFTNSGAVSVQTGTLEFDGGGTSSSTATFAIASGATLDLTGDNQTFTVTGSGFSGAGTLSLASGTLEFGSTADTIGSAFLQTHGTIDGTAELTIAGPATFTGSFDQENGSGTTLLQGTTSLIGTGNQLVDLDGGRVLENAGTLTVSGDTYNVINLGYDPFTSSVGGGTLINDAGANFNIQGDGIIVVSNSGTTGFTNAGTITKSVTTGISIIQPALTDTGAVSVQTGTLELDGGGTSSSAATFAIASGATLDLNGNSFTVTGSGFSGAGTLSLASGTLEFGSTADTIGTAFVQTHGTIDGAAKLTIAGAATFSGSFDQETGGGTTLLQGTTSLVGSGSQLVDLDGGRVLENAGTLTISGDTYNVINLGYDPYTSSVGGGTLINDVGANFNIQGDGEIVVANSGTTGFTNAGTITKSVTTGTSIIQPAFTDTGAVSVQTGTLEFDGGGTSSSAATFSIASGATLNLSGSGQTFTVAGSGFSGAGTVALAGGTLEFGSAADTIASAFSQTGGTIDGTAELTITGPATFAGSYDQETGPGTTLLQGTTSVNGTAGNPVVELDGGRVFENAGTLTVTGMSGGGFFTLGSDVFGGTVGGATLRNDAGANFNIQADGQLVQVNSGTTAFTNDGTVTKSASTGTSDVNTAFTNTGTISVTSGTLEFSGGFTDSGVISGAGTVDITGSATFTGSEVETGTGRAILEGPTSITGYVQLDGGWTLENKGVLTFTGPDMYLGYNPDGMTLGNGAIQNDAGGTFDFANDGGIVKETGTASLTNAGLVEKTGTTGESTVGVAFTNTGNVAVDTGTLLFDAGGSSSADGFSISSGAKLVIGGEYQTFTFSGGTITGAGLFEQAFGTISGAFTVAGAAELGGSDGYYGAAEETGAATTLLKGTTAVDGYLDLDGGHVLENQGTLTWTSGDIYVGLNPNATTVGGGTIENDTGATFDIQTDDMVDPGNGAIAKGSGTDGFTNAGLVEKTAGTGTARIGVAFTNSGTISVQSGTLEFDGGGSSSASAVTVDAGATFAIGGSNGNVALNAFTFSGGTIGGAGGFAQTGGTLSGTVTVDGTATIGGAGVYGNAEQSGSGTTILAGNTAIDGYLDLDGDHVLENQGTITWTTDPVNGGYIALGNNPNLSSLGGGVIQNDAGATFDIQSDAVVYADGGTTSFTNAGTLEKSVTTGTTDIRPDFTNSGMVSARTGTLEFDGAFTNTGAATVAAGATLDIAGTAGVTGTGTLTIDDGVLTVAHGISAGQTIDFSGTSGTLNLGDPASDRGTIGGFAIGDMIDLTGIGDGDQANLLAGNVLEITRSGGGGPIDIQLSPTDDFTGKYFHVTSAGMSGSTITEQTAPCYCHGTLIRTDRGETPVQDLVIGDRVLTLSGEARPIKWIGRRSYRQPFIGNSRDIVPILIRAGALADGVPVRDLYVSPLHAMFVDNVLIPAGLLVNGISVARCPHMDPVRYFHIELDSHDVILAEGAPSETFVDCDSRMKFHNAHEFEALYPGDSSAGWIFCAPRIEKGATLRRIWATIAARAGIGLETRNAAARARLEGYLDSLDGQTILGWAWTPDHPNLPVELEISDGDGVIARTMADRYRADLEQNGVGDGRHHFALTLDRVLSPWQPHEIHVRRVGDKAELPGSPIVVPAKTGLALLRDDRFGPAIEDALRAARSAAELDEALQLFLNEAERVRRIQARGQLKRGTAHTAQSGRTPRTVRAGRPAPCLKGHLDRVRNDLVEGWAWDPAHPDERIELEILESDIVIGRAIADRRRDDVRASGHGDGYCGFRLKLDVPLAAWRRHEIHIRRRSDKAALPGSPVTIGRSTTEGGPRQAIAALPSPAIGSRPGVGASESRKRVLVIDDLPPTPGKDGGSNAILGHIRAFAGLDYRVEFVAARQLDAAVSAADHFAGLDVMVHRAPMATSVEYVLRRAGDAYDCVYLHRLANAAAYAGLTRILCPSARILYSVADLHHVRLARQGRIQERPDILARARAAREAELLAMRQVDAVITHSPAEADYLHKEAPGARIFVAPWPVQLSPSATRFAERRSVAFIGGFSIRPTRTRCSGSCGRSCRSSGGAIPISSA